MLLYVMSNFLFIKIDRVGNVTNISGSMIIVSYAIVILCLIASLIVSLINIKKIRSNICDITNYGSLVYVNINF